MSFTSWFARPAEPQGWEISVYIFTNHYSHSLVKRAGQFTVNVPGAEMDEIVKYCGSVSGRDHDKFRECNLTKVASTSVAPPLIGECMVHLECVVQRTSPFTMTFPGQDRLPREMTIFDANIRMIHAREDVAGGFRGSAERAGDRAEPERPSS